MSTLVMFTDEELENAKHLEEVQRIVDTVLRERLPQLPLGAQILVEGWRRQFYDEGLTSGQVMILAGLEVLDQRDV